MQDCRQVLRIARIGFSETWEVPCMYAILLLCLLLRAETTMTAAAAACRLFVTAVLPGLFPVYSRLPLPVLSLPLKY